MKNIQISSVIALFLLAFALFPTIVTNAQEKFTGKWTAETDGKNNGKIQLNLTRKLSRNNTNDFGNTFALNDLQGLSREQLFAANSTVNFRLMREAGIIEFEGVFKNGEGSGTFTFSANQNFVAGMKSRGYNLNDDKLFSATALDLTLGFVDDLKSVGFADLDVEDLFKGKIFNVTPKFVAEMKSIGFTDLGMEDLVKARIFEIDIDFAKEVTEMGFAKDSIEDLVKLRIFKITPEYLREMKSIGFTNLSAEEATKLRIFKITPKFVREINSEGLTDLSVEEVTKLRIFNIDGKYIQLVKSKGYNDLDVEKLVDMKIFNRVK
jgi:predicted metallopeptidase